jgi:hypothetical protein
VESPLLFLFFPFVFFLLWGPFAFFFAARKVVGRLGVRHAPGATVVRSFVILMAMFLPVAVTSPGGNIAVVFPWWVAVLGLWRPLEAGVQFSGGSFVPAILATPVSLWVISREAKRTRGTKESDANE